MPPTDNPPPVTHHCPQCGASVSCASAANLPTCWCAELPHVIPMPDCTARCLCRSCLEAKIADVLHDHRQTPSETGNS